MTALYALFAVLWITVSDQAVDFLFPDHVTLIQTFKGWLFVLITTLLLYVVLRAEFTHRYAIEAELKKSEERFRIIADTSPVAILIIRRRDGKIRFCNEAAGELLDETPSNIVERLIEEFKVEARDGGPLPMFAEDIGRIQDLEGIIRRPNGAPRSILASFHPMELEGERVLLTAVVDITERNAADESLHDLQTQLAHVSRLSAMGELAAELAHELNQPLTAITNYASGSMRLIENKRMEPEEIGKAFQFIFDQTQRAGEIIRRVRQFARNESPERKPIEINQAIREAMDLLRSNAIGNAVSVELDLAESAPSVPADAIQIQQVIHNLARNAIEAMGEVPGDRVLTIKTRIDVENGFEVAVSDTGPGMSADVRDNLFTPFFSTKPDGLGMGLTICRTIVKSHGAELDLSSEEGAGTTFRFTLPFEDAASQTTP
ncbi:MAG: PAS domain S-box protein [Rhodospirillales bacterium]|nr:PAS domain S-box protein [Rhodospirillales bacterium]